MGYLMWEQPKRRMSKAEHASISFEEGPKGGYVPNMSDEDASAWKAKITGQKLGYPQVEIRKSAGGALLLIIVNLGDGYNYKQYETKPSRWSSRADHPWRAMSDTRTFGLGMHIALNGGGQLSVEEAIELPLVIAEAKKALEGLVKVPGERHHYAARLHPGTDIEDIAAKIEEAGGKVSARHPLFDFIYFTAPKITLDIVPMLSGAIRGIYWADDIAREARAIDDFRTEGPLLLKELNKRLDEGVIDEVP